MEEDIAKVSLLMQESLESDISLLSETNRGLLSNGGKMIRPITALLVARALGGCNSDTYLFAAAAELIHNATLMHDDVADSSALRRGRPTVVSLLGPRPSVLLGDFWLVKGIDRILDSQKYGNRVMRIFGRTLSHLAEGEMLQLELARTGGTTEDDYYKVIFDKTASLFEASAVSAVISTGAPETYVEAVSKFSRCLGMAFQIKDDIFDYQEEASIGKPTGQDLREKKITLPLLGAMKMHPSDEKEIRAKVCGIDSHPEYVAGIMDFVRKCGGISYADKKMKNFLKEAVAALDVFAPSREKEFLTAMADYIAERKY